MYMLRNGGILTPSLAPLSCIFNILLVVHLFCMFFIFVIINGDAVSSDMCDWLFRITNCQSSVSVKFLRRNLNNLRVSLIIDDLLIIEMTTSYIAIECETNKN